MLEQAGYRVQTARDGRAALARVGPAAADLLVLAGQAACRAGLEAWRRRRSEGAAAETPLLWLTPPGDVSMRLAALDLGAADVLPLPVEPPEFLARVRNLLAQKGRRVAAAQHEQDLTRLFTFAAQVHMHLDLPQVLGTLHKACREQFGFGQVVILLLDSTGQVLHPVTLPGTLDPGNGNNVGYAWSSMQPLLDRRYRVSHSYFVSHTPLPEGPAPPGPWKPGDTLLVPLRLPRGRWLGLLSLDAPRDGCRPTRQQVRLVELFADHTAVAIHNAQLYAEQQSRLAAYVAAPVAAQLRARGIPLPPPSEAQVTVLFSDLREFTALAERLTAAQLVDQVLNPYFRHMTDVIYSHGGIVDKFLGDGIMAVFGLPSWQGDEAARAVLAGLAMQNVFRGLQERWHENLGWEIGMGIGIASGQAVVGNIGSPQRMDYTAIGPVVNTASRVASRAPGGQVWATGDAVVQAENHIYTDSARRAAFPLIFRPLMPTVLKGVRDPQVVYACLLG
jgi:class 3 adenylate cyclase/CheY-like chemotaxis protein